MQSHGHIKTMNTLIDFVHTELFLSGALFVIRLYISTPLSRAQRYFCDLTSALYSENTATDYRLAHWLHL